MQFIDVTSRREKVLTMRCSADAEDEALLTCSMALQMTRHLEVRRLWWNGGTHWPVAGVGMACFIVASVECDAAFPVVPCRRLAHGCGVQKACVSIGVSAVGNSGETW
jgi:hypothetical protein